MRALTPSAHGMVRRHTPKRVIELGSGSSSPRDSLKAWNRNAQESKPCSYEIFDPYPNPHSRPRWPAFATTTRLGVTEIPLSTLEGLGDGDVLFVDTTHTVKTGSDVNYIVLDGRRRYSNTMNEYAAEQNPAHCADPATNVPMSRRMSPCRAPCRDECPHVAKELTPIFPIISHRFSHEGC